jgi:hypothetical protein
MNNLVRFSKQVDSRPETEDCLNPSAPSTIDAHPPTPFGLQPHPRELLFPEFPSPQATHAHVRKRALSSPSAKCGMKSASTRKFPWAAAQNMIYITSRAAHHQSHPLRRTSIRVRAEGVSTIGAWRINDITGNTEEMRRRQDAIRAQCNQKSKRENHQMTQKIKPASISMMGSYTGGMPHRLKSISRRRS